MLRHIKTISLTLTLKKSAQFERVGEWNPYPNDLPSQVFNGYTKISSQQERISRIEVYRSTGNCLAGVRIESNSGERQQE